MFKQLYRLLLEPLLGAFTHNFEIHPDNTRQSRDRQNFPFALLCLLKVFLRQHV